MLETLTKSVKKEVPLLVVEYKFLFTKAEILLLEEEEIIAALIREDIQQLKIEIINIYYYICFGALTPLWRPAALIGRRRTMGEDAMVTKLSSNFKLPKHSLIWLLVGRSKLPLRSMSSSNFPDTTSIMATELLSIKVS